MCRQLTIDNERYSRENAGEIAVVSGRDALSRVELWRAVAEATEEIRSVVGGVRRAVVIHLPNCTEWVVTFLAVLRAGHVPATLPVTTPEAHLRHIFDLIRPALAICAGRNLRASPDAAIRRAAAGASTEVPVTTADGARLTMPGQVTPPQLGPSTCPTPLHT